MGELHPVTAIVRNASAPLVIHTDHYKQKRENDCVSPKLFNSQPKLSVDQETTRERICDFLFLHFWLWISNHKQVSFFVLPLNCLKIGHPHIFVLFF